MTVLATINLNFGRSHAKQRADVRRLHKRAQIVAQQEVRFLWWCSERVSTRGLQVLRRGTPLAARSRHGQKIGWRRMPWKLVAIPGVGRTMVVSVHMPPRRMHRSGLYEAYAKTLHRLLARANRKGWHWIVLGDWNKRRTEDPAHLTAAFGATWVGARIDLAAVSPSLRDHLGRVRVEHDPTRRDGHPQVLVNLNPDIRA